jgi:hypothetical protein
MLQGAEQAVFAGLFALIPAEGRFEHRSDRQREYEDDPRNRKTASQF